jgi:mRNA-degrading endonuclease RelE of RelBE toxin-antitoxin system
MVHHAQAELGLRFYKHLQASLLRIKKHPLAFALRYKTNRTARVNKFPYMVHYFVGTEKKIIVVTAVLHTSRDSKLWERS